MYMTAALTEAKSIKGQVLAKAHPQLPAVYRDQYIRSIELAIIAHESGVAEPESGPLMNQWNDWWAANKNDVHFPKNTAR